MSTEPAKDRTVRTIARLPPGYFALVMATGIVSVGCAQRGWTVVSLVLLGVAAVAYATLVVLNAWRLLRHRAALLADVRDPRTAFQFFTFVAATDVLAVGIAAHGPVVPGAVLLVVAGLAWAVLGYAIPGSVVLGGAERPILRAANGSWLVWVVASQSVAVASATLEPHFPALRQWLAIVAVLSWSVGIMLYAATALFVSARLLQYPVAAEEIEPAYWIAMGAVAITVLAGARIVEMDSAPMVDSVRGLVAGLAVLMWCFATWLVPALIAVGVWRHGVHRVPLHYEPGWWSIVFPLGMYAVAGMYLGRADRLPIVEWIGAHWIWVALTAWCVAFVGMVRAWIVRVR